MLNTMFWISIRKQLFTQKLNLTNRFATSDGVERDETGELVNAGTDNEDFIVKGSYSYTGPDNIVYKVFYVASKDGFVPVGDHIPKE